MATSGSNNFTQTRDQVIYNAFQHLGVYGVGQTMSAEDVAFAITTLNAMIKTWGCQGLHLWCKGEGVLYLSQYQAKYSIGDTASDAHSTLLSDEIITQLNGALTANATAVTVDSTTGMTIGDYIGIVLSNKSLYWTTIATIPTSTTLTLTAGVTSAALDNGLVFTFTNKLYKPSRISSARSITGIDLGATSSRTEVQLNPIAYETYFNLPTKTTNGSRPVQFHYNPRLTSGNFYAWPRPSDCACRIEFTYERSIEDLDSASDNFDFPPEWIETLTFNLAVRMGPAFGKDQKVIQTLGPLASDMLKALKEWDDESDSIILVPGSGRD